MLCILRTLVRVENLVNVSNHRHKNVVLGSVLCRHDLAESAKSADIWLSGRHVADMSATLPAKRMNSDLVKCPIQDQTKSAYFHHWC